MRRLRREDGAYALHEIRILIQRSVIRSVVYHDSCLSLAGDSERLQSVLEGGGYHIQRIDGGIDLALRVQVIPER